MENLLDGGLFDRGAHRDFGGLAHQARRQFANRGGVGGRKQQGLAVLAGFAGDLADVVLEAHVEHAIGLVQHQSTHGAQFERLLLQQFQHPSRRAHDHVRRSAQ